MKSINEFVNQILCGDSLGVLARVPSNAIDMCLTSPPYYGLRDYGVDGQLGLEKTPEEYIEKMTEIFHEVKRVLKKEGTLWLNIGDTYFGSGCGTNDYRTPASISLSRPELYDSPRPQNIKQHKYLKPKSLCMIPERLAWALIQDGWILRNKIVWHKLNPMPASVKDRFNNTWEFMFLFAKSKRYYFDLDAVREPHKEHSIRRACRAAHRDGKPYAARGERDYIGYENIESNFKQGKLRDVNALGKNPGDHWDISTKSFPLAHFSVFPKKLCERPIKAGCPEGGIVLDPFCGAGTALFVAKEMRRRYIGIDIKQEYVDMTKKRLAQGVL